MYSPKVRLVLILICVGASIAILLQGDPVGFVPLLAAAAFAFGYRYYGTVWLAFRALRKGEMARAEGLIDKVSEPERLGAEPRAYHDMIRGVIALDRNDLAAAETFLDAAASGALRTSNDRSIVACYRARVAAQRGNRESAQALLDQARREPHKAAVCDLIADVEREMP